VVFCVEICDGGYEAVGDTMLLIKVDGTLNCMVAKHITVGEVLSNDSASRLLFLSDLVTITLGIVCKMTSIILAAASSTGNLYVGSSKLSVIEQKGSLGRRLFLKSYGRILGWLGRSDLKGSDLAADNGYLLSKAMRI
jgi:hypothetical protein